MSLNSNKSVLLKYIHIQSVSCMGNPEWNGAGQYSVPILVGQYSVPISLCVDTLTVPPT